MMNDGVQATMPMTPAYSNNDGMFGSGGNWIWIILLFFLISGNGFGGANAATNQINSDFLYTQQKVDALGQALISQTNQLNQSMNAGFNSVNSGLCNLGHQIDMGFCGVNRNIDGVKFQMAQDTCAITTAIGASTQTLLGYLTGQEIANWRERALSAENRENNANQTAAINAFAQNLVNSRFPYPVPANVVGYGYPGGAIPTPFFGGCNPCNPCAPC